MVVARALVADTSWNYQLGSEGAGAPLTPVMKKARVVNSFNHSMSFQLEGQRPQLWTIVTAQKPPSPATLICDLPQLPHLEVGSEILISSQGLEHELLNIKFAGCKFLSCQIAPTHSSIPDIELLTWALSQWKKLTPRGSFRKRERCSEVDLHIHQKLVCGANQFLVGITSSENTENLREVTKNFLGLGAGLTPSGDDFIVGVLAVLSATGQKSEARKIICQAVRENLTNTTEVSQQFLEAALQGRFNHAVAQVVYTLIDEDMESAKAAIEELLKHGSTSGGDTLLGILAAIASLCQPPLHF
ncbi:DUF2877 domain-containing protein [Actinomycetaceae bacterium TAE3-ERU4]|nr:DUF2877 domain-containing protein [Actinomycetaceae bacterium TAE3-ERU4]